MQNLMLFSNQVLLTMLSQCYLLFSAGTTLGICVIPVVALCCSAMFAVLWSAVLHAMLYTAQTLQTL